MKRPDTLTRERSLSYLPRMEVSEEWQRKHDAGELPEGLHGMRGMMKTTWPAEQPTREEAEYILWLADQGSMRWLAAKITEDSNQLFGMWLIEAAQRVIDKVKD